MIKSVKKLKTPFSIVSVRGLRYFKYHFVKFVYGGVNKFLPILYLKNLSYDL